MKIKLCKTCRGKCMGCGCKSRSLFCAMCAEECGAPMEFWKPDECLACGDKVKPAK